MAREALRAPIADDERRWLLLDWDFVLGLDLHGVWDKSPVAGDVPDEIQRLVDDRARARAARDYARSDALRDQLATMGWDITDGTDGQTVRQRQGVT